MGAQYGDRLSETKPTRLTSTVAVLLTVVYLAMSVGVIAMEWSIHNGPDASLLAPVGLSAYVFVGALIILRRGSHPIGWVLQAIGITAWSPPPPRTTPATRW